MKNLHIADSKTPAQENARALEAAYTLENYGLSNLKNVYWNLSPKDLIEEAVFRGEGHRTQTGAFAVDTSVDTTPAINDRFVVRESETEDLIWWGENNRPFLARKFSAVYQRVQAYLQGKDLFVRDCYAGVDPRYRLPVRVITEGAWHSLSAHNLLIQPETPDEMRQFIPEFTIICVPGFEASPMIDSTMSERVILLNLDQKICLIGGSGNIREIEDAISKSMTHILSRDCILPLHCSAGVDTGDNEHVALFFGLSGAGWAALSGIKNQEMVADGGLGWSDDGVFGFEGGVYADVNGEAESVELNPKVVGHPRNIFMITCDTAGVLPPVARLSPEQAAYHFVSGYSSTVGDNQEESGKAPVTMFSPGFGASLMVRHPQFYAEQLKNKIQRHKVNCWLVNTGWTGGPFGTGKRISVDLTQALLGAAVDGKLSETEFDVDPVFSFEVPKSCVDVPDKVLNPGDGWEDGAAFREKRVQLAALFVENFRKYADECSPEITSAGPGKENR